MFHLCILYLWKFTALLSNASTIIGKINKIVTKKIIKLSIELKDLKINSQSITIDSGSGFNSWNISATPTIFNEN